MQDATRGVRESFRLWLARSPALARFRKTLEPPEPTAAQAAPTAPSFKTLRYVFIVTYGRSGSTLLSQILNSIDGYRIQGENYDALRGIFQAYESLRTTRKKHGRGTPPLHAWTGANEVQPVDFVEKCLTAFVEDVLRPQPGDRVVGFKEIRYFHKRESLDAYIAFMMRFFPKARFVVNIRNPDDVAKSGWWKGARNVHARLAYFNQTLRELAEEHGERFYLVDYDLYGRDEMALEGLFAWLGEPFQPERLKEVMAARIYS